MNFNIQSTTVSKFIVILLCSLSSFVFSQSDAEQLKVANDNYKKKEYHAATKNYKNLWSKIEKDERALLQAGISAFEANDPGFAIRCLNQLQFLTDPFDKNVNWYLAKSYQHTNQFEEAITAYKRFLKFLEEDDVQRSFVKNELLRCEEGKKLKRKLPLAIVESIGPGINTTLDEYAALPDIRHNGSYYISAIRADNLGGKRNDEGMIDIEKGRFRSDIYFVNQSTGNWSLNRTPDTQINSNLDDVVLGFTTLGTVMIFNRSWNDQKGAILIDTLDDFEVKLNHSRFMSPMIAEIGDHAMTLFQDTVMIFSSCRLGGYGGYDLYLSLKRNEQWSAPMNLGSKINTAFNEDFPFLAKDGLTLYYSSDNLKSIGGYDIFKTKYLPEARYWMSPQNLGIPVNSAGNDIYFRLTNDGLAGIFSSDRKSDNLGGLDIYFAYFKDDLSEQLEASMGSLLGSIAEQENAIMESGITTTDEALTENLQREEYKNYFIEAVYYSEEDFIHDAKNQKILDKLVAMMQLHPDLKIQFIGHSYQDSQDPVNLYFSIKKAEELQSYLLSKKVSGSRISCAGLGPALPVAKESINGNKSVAGEKWNKRIEVNLIQPDSSKLKINYAPVPVPVALKSNQTESFRSMRMGLRYSLYLGESGSILNHPLVRFSEGIVFVEKNAVENRYRYYFGLYKTFKQAESDLKKYEDLHKVKLDVKAFQSGRELSRSEIIEHVLQHEDLLIFLNYLNAKDKNRR